MFRFPVAIQIHRGSSVGNGAYLWLILHFSLRKRRKTAVDLILVFSYPLSFPHLQWWPEFSRALMWWDCWSWSQLSWTPVLFSLTTTSRSPTPVPENCSACGWSTKRQAGWHCWPWGSTGCFLQQVKRIAIFWEQGCSAKHSWRSCTYISRHLVSVPREKLFGSLRMDPLHCSIQADPSLKMETNLLSEIVLLEHLSSIYHKSFDFLWQYYERWIDISQSIIKSRNVLNLLGRVAMSFRYLLLHWSFGETRLKDCNPTGKLESILCQVHHSFG